MKKGFWFILLFILVVTGGIQLYKTMSVQGDTIEVVRKTTEVSMNDFLKKYTD